MSQILLIRNNFSFYNNSKGSSKNNLEEVKIHLEKMIHLCSALNQSVCEWWKSYLLSSRFNTIFKDVVGAEEEGRKKEHRWQKDRPQKMLQEQ